MGNCRVTLYTRTGCCLCEEAKQVIESARQSAEFEFEQIDIDAVPELRALYNDEVPVVAIDGRKAFKYRLTLPELIRKLESR
jgi:glutaredoxin